MRRVCALTGLVACAMAGGAARAAETPERFRVDSFAEVLPPTTIFFLEIPDYARARAAYRATPRWELWWEGAGRRLISQFLKSAGDKELTAFFRSFAAAAALPTGKATFAIEGPDPGDEFGMPMSSFLAEVGGGAEEFKRLVKTMCGAGLVEGEEAVIQRVRFDEMDELLVGSEGGFVMGGLGRTALNGLLSRFAERPWQSLAGNPAYKLAKSRALSGAHFMTFTNYTDIWRLAAMELDEEWLPFERTGLPQLAATSLSGRFTPEGVVDKLSFILRGRARGVWKLLRPEPLSRKAWRLLPDFTSGFVAMKLPERTQGFLDFLRALEPDQDDRRFRRPDLAEEFLAPFREFREETGINFEKDILRLSTGEYTVVFLKEDPDRGATAAPADPRRAMMIGEQRFFRHVLLLVELSDPAKARAMMDRLAAADDFGERMGRPRRFGDLDGWEFGDEHDGPLCVAGLDGIGMLALSPEPIERLAAHIAKGRARLVDSAEFRKATRWIPADTGFAAYSDVRKIMPSLHKLASSGLGMRRREPVDLPKEDALHEGLSPLTACVRIEKPGFAFEIHSPDGIWAYYFQMMAHCLWRFDEEPRQKRRLARQQLSGPGLPPVSVPGADPETAKAYADLRRRIATIKTPHLRIAELERSVKPFRGTPYARHIEQAISREKEAVLSGAYFKAMAQVHKIKGPAERIRFLNAMKPQFAGTRYELMIEKTIKVEEARASAPAPVTVPGADPETAKAFAELMEKVGTCRSIDERIAMLEASRGRFRGTPYEKSIEQAIAHNRTQRMAPVYKATMTRVRRLKSPEARVRLLRQTKLHFAGTRYEAMIDRMIVREEARAKTERPEPEPLDDQDDVF